MRPTRLLRTAPLTCLFVCSWAVGLAGIAAGLGEEQGLVAGVWAGLVAPAYGVALVGLVLGVPFPWGMLGALLILGLIDAGMYLLREEREEPPGTRDVSPAAAARTEPPRARAAHPA